MEIYKPIYGIIARIFNVFISTKKKCWVFGADYGNSYREGPKYLLEYMLHNHPEYTCTFVTRNKEVLSDLKKKGVPCEYALSIKGVIKVCKADAIFTSHFMEDVLFSYPKKGRKHFQLVHGQPYKLAYLALPEAYENVVFQKSSRIRWRNAFRHWLYYNWKLTDTAFASATSDFLAIYMDKDFGHLTPIKVLGMPRNDALFHHDEMKNEKWLNGLEGKKVFIYMPTHRAYGKGMITPTPFANRLDIQQWMRDNNVVLLMKNHPNMMAHVKEPFQNDVIIDITAMGIDPQVCIYNSDALITDYSSVWMDYLILRRPIIFYTYDNWENDDAGVHYDIHEDAPGYFCNSEEELYHLMKRVAENPDSMIASKEVLAKFHKYIDGNSCERYYHEICKLMYHE
jgi:CDP-glycerol glycerophosphotransferase (TagB/SpsB family)